VRWQYPVAMVAPYTGRSRKSLRPVERFSFVLWALLVPTRDSARRTLSAAGGRAVVIGLIPFVERSQRPSRRRRLSVALPRTSMIPVGVATPLR